MKVFCVIESIAYEGDTLISVHSTAESANRKIKEKEIELNLHKPYNQLDDRFDENGCISFGTRYYHIGVNIMELEG